MITINAPKFTSLICTELHLRCTTDANTWWAAESRDEVRLDLESLHTALRTGVGTVPLHTRCFEPQFQEDRDAAALLATEAGRPFLQEAAQRLPHVHYWLRGGQLVTEIVDRQIVIVRGLPDTYEVWAVDNFGDILVGDDDLMAVYAYAEDGHMLVRVLLWAGALPHEIRAD